MFSVECNNFTAISTAPFLISPGQRPNGQYLTKVSGHVHESKPSQFSLIQNQSEIYPITPENFERVSSGSNFLQQLYLNFKHDKRKFENQNLSRLVDSAYETWF